jgi:hypothetical protein
MMEWTIGHALLGANPGCSAFQRARVAMIVIVDA